MESADVPKPSDGDGIVGGNWPTQSETAHRHLADGQRLISTSCQGFASSLVGCADPALEKEFREMSHRSDTHLCLSALLKTMAHNILVTKEGLASVVREFRSEQEGLSAARSPDDERLQQSQDKARQAVHDLSSQFRSVHDHLNATAILISGKDRSHG